MAGGGRGIGRMARLGRYFVAGQALHVIQRGNDRQRVFFSEEDYLAYGAWLAEAARERGCALHAAVQDGQAAANSTLTPFSLRRFLYDRFSIRRRTKARRV